VGDRRQKIQRLEVVGPLLMPLVVWVLVLALQTRGQPDPALCLDHLALLRPDPATAAALGLAERGHTWHMSRARECTLRHRFPGPASAASGPLALYVPSVDGNIEVFLDGTKIGDGGPLGPHAERNRHRPLLFGIPAGLLGPGEHALDLRVVNSSAFGGFLQPVFLGPPSLLEPAYRWQYAFKVTSMQMILVTLLMMVLFIAALWAKRPSETVYAWFAAGLCFWAIYNLNYLLTGWPVNLVAWAVLIHVALGAFLYCMILFVHRLAGIRPTSLERAFSWLSVLSIAALVAAALSLEPSQVWSVINLGYRFVLLGLGAYLLVRLSALCLERRTPAFFWLASATLLTFSLGVHDSLRQLDVLDTAVPGLMQYGAVVALLVFGYIVVARFADALRQSEVLNVTLDGRVRDKTRELEEQFARTRSLEREMVLAQERERLVRDMHDGMGGQLVSLITLVRSGRGNAELVEQALAECLQDLRLMIDSMDTASEDLAVGLGMLRSRLEPRLRAMGLAVHWNTHELPAGIRLGPEGVLQVFRILQEALQNAIKHAAARALWIEAQADGSPTVPAIRVTVRDDGIGFPASRPEGRGLGNMRYRAERLGATLTVDSIPTGTRVTLLIPAPR